MHTDTVKTKEKWVRLTNGLLPMKVDKTLNSVDCLMNWLGNSWQSIIVVKT